MLALCSMLSGTYYAHNYASIIDGSLVNCSESENIALMVDGLNCVRSWRRRSLTPATKCVKGSYWNAQLYAVIVIYLMLD